MWLQSEEKMCLEINLQVLLNFAKLIRLRALLEKIGQIWRILKWRKNVT